MCRYLGLLAFAALLLPSAVLAQEDVLSEIQIQEDRIERVSSETGERMWSNRHASVWSNSDMKKMIARISEPVGFGEHILYGVRSWILEVDPQTGVIQRRHWLPSEVVAIESAEDGFAVTLESHDTDSEERLRTEVSWNPSTPSSQHAWSYLGYLAPWKEAFNLAPGTLKGAYLERQGA